MRRLVLGLVSVALALFIGSPVSGALLEKDWQAAGDKLLTWDTATGLEWLDWAYTVGRPYVDVSDKLDAGEEFAGFRFPSEAEMTTLLMHGMEDPTRFPGQYEEEAESAERFVELFGTTTLIGLGPLSVGYYDWPLDNPKCGVVAWHLQPGGPPYSLTGSFALHQYSPPHNTHPAMGAALVRQGTVVPEPSTCLICSMLAALGLFWYRRR